MGASGEAGASGEGGGGSGEIKGGGASDGEEEEGAEVAKRVLMAQRTMIARTVGELPHEVRGELDTTRKRPNARTRKKIAKRRAQLKSTGGGGSFDAS